MDQTLQGQSQQDSEAVGHDIRWFEKPPWDDTLRHLEQGCITQNHERTGQYGPLTPIRRSAGSNRQQRQSQEHEQMDHLVRPLERRDRRDRPSGQQHQDSDNERKRSSLVVWGGQIAHNPASLETRTSLAFATID